MKGFTWVVKLPLESATAPPATLLLGGSQMSVIDSLGRNAPPLTVICVLGSPAVTSSERNALVGVGVGIGDGEGVGEGEGVGDGEGEGEAIGEGGADGVGVGVVSVSTIHTGSATKIQNSFIEARKVTSYLNGRPGYRPG